MHKRLIAILAAGAALGVQARAAAPQTDCPGDDCVVVGKWNFSVALGAGIRTNPLVNTENLPIVLVPEFSYYGKRFFIDNLDFGFTLLDEQANTLSLIATPDYDRAFFYRSDLQNTFVSVGSGGVFDSVVPPQHIANTLRSDQFPARPRRVTYLAGPEWTFKYLGITGQLDVLHEITDQDQGTEVRAALGIPLLRRPDSLALNLGVTWKSSAIVNYYYGAPGVYQGGAALDPFLKLSYLRPLSKKWRFNAMVQYERLGDAIADSPIVAKSYVVTAFVGAVYSF
jgi:outer membrane protein